MLNRLEAVRRRDVSRVYFGAVMVTGSLSLVNV